MKNKKLLFILIPVLIVVLALIAGVIYLKLNSSPEKIFQHSINKVFGMFDTAKQDYSTMKGTMSFTGGIELGEIETEYKDRLEGLEKTVQTINDILEGSSINIDMQADIFNMIINENINVTLNNENLLNAAIILQDQKGYVYLKDYLDKYLELPEEDFDYTELSEYYRKIYSIDFTLLKESIKEELIGAIQAQELLQEDTTLILDGQETNVTASTLSLKNEEIENFTKGFLTKLKINEKFQNALGTLKDDIILMIDDEIKKLDDMNNSQAYENILTEIKEVDEEIKYSIYTKGILNEFVGISIKNINVVNNASVLEILKHNENQYKFIAYTEKDNKKNAILELVIETRKESKNKGTATITMTAGQEQFIATYNYEKQGNQLSFGLSTEIEGVGLNFSGNTVESGNNIKGNMIISVQEETFGRANLNYTYDFTYGVQVQKVNTENSVLIDELSEEDQTILTENLQESPLYQLIEQFGVIDSELNTLKDEPEITNGKYSVIYNIPANFKSSSYNSNSDDMKMYSDDKYNLISVYIIHNNASSYLEKLEEEEYVLTSDFYKNQQISETKKYTVNGKEYSFRTITYDDDYGTYVNLYFAYALDDEYCYAVDVKSEGGNISMDTIKHFLDVTVEKESLQNMFSDAEEFLNDGQV